MRESDREGQKIETDGEKKEYLSHQTLIASGRQEPRKQYV